MRFTIVFAVVALLLCDLAVGACPADPTCEITVCNGTSSTIVQAGKPDAKLSPSLCHMGTKLRNAQSGEARVAGVPISSFPVVTGGQNFSASFFKLYSLGIGHETLQKGQLETLTKVSPREICVVLPISTPEKNNCIQFQLTLPGSMPSSPEPIFETPPPSHSTPESLPPVESESPPPLEPSGPLTLSVSS